MCLIQENQYYAMSLSLCNKSLSIPWVQVYTMSLSLYHIVYPWVTMSPSLYHHSKSIHCLLVYTMIPSQCLAPFEESLLNFSMYGFYISLPFIALWASMQWIGLDILTKVCAVMLVNTMNPSLYHTTRFREKSNSQWKKSNLTSERIPFQVRANPISH